MRLEVRKTHRLIVRCNLIWPTLVRVLRIGGLLVVDNVLSHADGMAEFRALVANDERVVQSLVPIGAGLLLVVKEPSGLV
jgi:predicted O-methyltransferase YrrM